ncbi:MAG: glycosyltransferase, partial [Muribaculaceae bacterium]|nr:glycosyltransferase [Muribaculaceae bacterium]
AHFNEWTTGMGLLFIKWKLPAVATVFTTHATSIGRSICGNGKPLYDYLEGYNGDQMAAELNMQSKHSLEKAAAQNADCFTTVSDVTAAESAQLLERTPDVVTPNGFEPGFVPSKADMPEARKKARNKLLKMASTLTGKPLSDETAIIATSGRCEYRNKGIDLYLDAINELRATAFDRNILALVLVPAWSGQARKDLTEAMKAEKMTKALHDPVVTHELHNYDYDAILSRIHQLNFNIIPSDNISVIYIPCYLNGNDGVIDMPYYDVLPGLDVTVFPSYYEPWGYTPLESVAFGVPTVTTTLAGFGQWVLSSVGDKLDTTGVKVVKRTDHNYDTVVKEIADTLSRIVHDPSAHSKLEKAAQKTAAKADWKHFIGLYEQAFEIAINNCHKRNI